MRLFQTFDGSWFFDYRHGFGKYKWPNSNAYEGMFYMNNREGYGTLMYATGDVFQVSVRLVPTLKESKSNISGHLQGSLQTRQPIRTWCAQVPQ